MNNLTTDKGQNPLKPEQLDVDEFLGFFEFSDVDVIKNKNFYNEFKNFLYNLNSKIDVIFEKFINIFSIFDLFYRNLDFLDKNINSKKKTKLNFYLL